MSDEIIKVINDLCDKFGIAIDWTNQNVMPYMQELMTRLISYQNACAIVWIVLSAITTIVCVILGVKSYKQMTSEEGYYSEAPVVTEVLSVTIGIIAVIILLCNIFGLIQNIYVPELTVLDYIKNWRD